MMSSLCKNESHHRRMNEIGRERGDAGRISEMYSIAQEPPEIPGTVRPEPLSKSCSG